MKHLLTFLIVCFALGTYTFGQQNKLTMKVTANSAVVSNSTVEVKDQKRILWFVGDCMPMNSGYAYEFGPLYLVAPNGQRSELKAKEVCNGPVFRYSVSKQLFQQYPQGFKLEIDAIKRYNPNNTSEILPFPKKDLELNIVPAN